MSAHPIIASLRQAKLELQHDYMLEQFWFIDDKCVVATLGTKNGPICGPILNYEITDDDAVEIIDSDGVRLLRMEVATDLRRFAEGTVRWGAQNIQYLQRAQEETPVAMKQTVNQ